MEGLSLYRKLDPENIDHYHKFPNQTAILTKIYETKFSVSVKQCTTGKVQFQFQCVELINLKSLKNLLKNLKDTLQNFKNTDNPFFDSIIYGVMFRISKGKVLEKNKAENALGKDFYAKVT